MRDSASVEEKEYQAKGFQSMLLCSGLQLRLVRDGSNMITDLDAHVRSGDYFSTLATLLDALCEKLPLDSDEAMQLERQVRDLLYIDSKYKIISKKIQIDYVY